MIAEPWGIIWITQNKPVEKVELNKVFRIAPIKFNTADLNPVWGTNSNLAPNSKKKEYMDPLSYEFLFHLNLIRIDKWAKCRLNLIFKNYLQTQPVKLRSRPI